MWTASARVSAPSVIWGEAKASVPSRESWTPFGVGVLVFNDALLSWGALMSATSTPADVARGVHAVLDRIAAGTTKELPPLTPLTEIKLQVNGDVASRLGVGGAREAPWVLRDPD